MPFPYKNFLLFIYLIIILFFKDSFIYTIDYVSLYFTKNKSITSDFIKGFIHFINNEKRLVIFIPDDLKEIDYIDYKIYKNNFIFYLITISSDFLLLAVYSI